MNLLSTRRRVFALLLNGLLYIIYSASVVLGIIRKNRESCADPTKFLISRLDRIGDVILSTPIYHSLKDRYPRSQIAVLCGSWAKEVLDNNPFIDEIIQIDCPWWNSCSWISKSYFSFLNSYIGVYKLIRRNSFDVFIDLRGDIRQVFLFGWLTGIPRRISNNRSGGTFLLTDQVEHMQGLHEIDQSYNIVELISPLKRYYKTEVYNTTIEIENVSAQASSACGANDRFCVIFNGGRSDLRKISNKLVASIVDYLVSRYRLNVIFVGDEHEYVQGEELRRYLSVDQNKFKNFCSKFRLRELRELINRSAFFLGTDSSVSHLAASTSVPSVCVYGPGTPELTRPLGLEKRIIFHRYPCSPCLQTTCEITNSSDIGKCMHEISLEEMKAEIDALIDGRKDTEICSVKLGSKS